jgi:hypothetical protein
MYVCDCVLETYLSAQYGLRLRCAPRVLRVYMQHVLPNLVKYLLVSISLPDTPTQAWM